MLYTCPKCNQSFNLPLKEVNEARSFTCPHCQAHFDFGELSQSQEHPYEEPEEEITATIDTSANLAEQESGGGTPQKKTKACPFCGEEILETALKCKHCGELLSPSNPLYAQLNIQPPSGTPSKASPQPTGYAPQPAAYAPQPAAYAPQSAAAQPVYPQPAPAYPPYQQPSAPVTQPKSYLKVWNGWGTALLVFFLEAVFMGTMCGIAGDVDAERRTGYLLPLFGLISLVSFILIIVKRTKIPNPNWNVAKYMFIFVFLVNSGLITVDRKTNGPFLVLAIGMAVISSYMFLYKTVDSEKDVQQ